MLASMTEEQERVWIASQLDMMTVGSKCTYTFEGNTVCQEDWCRLNGFSSWKLNAGKKLCKSTLRNNVDERLPEPDQYSETWLRTAAWLDVTLKGLCDQMPHEDNVWRLPTGLTLDSLHDMYVTDYANRPPDMGTGKTKHTYKYSTFVECCAPGFQTSKKPSILCYHSAIFVRCSSRPRRKNYHRRIMPCARKSTLII
jgi:hypothetical protein